jgi:hypothetical protein
LPKMPWVKNEDDILDLADLPKLRAFDAHPDAPARRPLSASSDLAEPMALAMQSFAQPPVTSDAETEAAAAVETPVEPAFEIDSVALVADEAHTGDTSLADMVAQLEAAVIQRKAQLAELEIVAARLSTDNGHAGMTDEAIIAPVGPKTEILPPEPTRPVLEAVPPSPRLQVSNAGEDDMDAALSAALETLQRMNTQAR